MLIINDFKMLAHYFTVAPLLIATTQPAFTCSKLTIEKLEQGVKYVQS